MTKMKEDGRIRGAAQTPAAKIRRRILASQNKFWHSSKLPGPESTIQHLLTQLDRDGELTHVRKGLYWRGTKTPLGMSPPPNDSLTNTIVKTANGIGPAGLSAANLLKLSTQVPRYSMIAVPHRAPTSLGSVTFVSRASRTDRRTARLTSHEVALLEALEGWDRIIEIPMDEAWIKMSKLLISKDLDAMRLARAARTEPGSVRVRLSALLNASGYKEEAKQIPTADRRTVAAARVSDFLNPQK